MANILHIESSTRLCSVALSKDQELISLKESTQGNDHAAILASSISLAVKEAGLKMKDIQAVAVSMGPGSYTGLRIGLSMAKGLCYSLEKPLIGISALQAMALAQAKACLKDTRFAGIRNKLFCPMLDAGRMEVYAGIYSQRNKCVQAVDALLLEEDPFDKYLEKFDIVFCGNALEKSQEILKSKAHAHIGCIKEVSASYMIDLALEKFKNRDFENLAYVEPFYLKEYLVGKSRVKGLD